MDRLISDSDDRLKLAELLFPDIQASPADIEANYPSRQLPAGAMVTRIAPSPTGFMHIGGIYAALICQRLAHQSGGIFFLRIEDTDKKREVDGAAELIINSLKQFGLNIDEGEVAIGQEIGDYGPYRQSQRQAIYQTFIKALLVDGRAYPAFETAEELEAINTQQTAAKIAPGYYGQWAAWRDRPTAEALAALEAGQTPVIRLRSTGDPQRTIIVQDLFKGRLVLPESHQDIVILKSNGLPTYHFAHAIDDHLMGTTHVIRGDEWLSSLSLHLQLFQLFGWTPPVFGHLAPIQKLVGQSRRKLSKRHDPEASVAFYDQAGYPIEAVIMYLLNLANAGFEQWLVDHPNDSLTDYSLSIDELKKGAGALLDMVKLASFSKELISHWSVDEIIRRSLHWAEQYDSELAKAMKMDLNYTSQLLNIDRQGDQARKDIAKWSDLRSEISFFFDDLFDNSLELALQQIDRPLAEIQAIARAVAKQYDLADDKDNWLNKMRAIGSSLGYAPDMKTFKQNPEQYRGNFGDVAKVIRVLLVGRNQSPDLFEVMRVMGRDRVINRLTRLV